MSPTRRVNAVRVKGDTPLRGRGCQRDKGRGKLIESALLITAWVESRHCIFHVNDVARVLECTKRTAYRWLNTMESQGLVEVEKGRAGFWRKA